MPMIEPAEVPQRLYSPSTAQISFDITTEDPFLIEVMNRILPQEFQKTFLNSTDKMYILLYPEVQGGGYFLVALGKYSRKTINLALTFKKGWAKRGDTLKYWENQRTHQQIFFWSENLLLISSDRMEEAQEKLRTPRPSPLPAAEPSEAPLSVFVPNPNQFMGILPLGYPDLTEKIKSLTLKFHDGGGDTASLSGVILFDSKDSAGKALHPFKIFLMAETKREGFSLVKKLMSESVIEHRLDKITFSHVPLAKESLTALLAKIFIP